MRAAGCSLIVFVLIVACIQVSNPSIQFMLYETLLKKLKEKRASSKNSNKGVTALEASFSPVPQVSVSLLIQPLRP